MEEEEADHVRDFKIKLQDAYMQQEVSSYNFYFLGICNTVIAIRGYVITCIFFKWQAHICICTFVCIYFTLLDSFLLYSLFFPLVIKEQLDICSREEKAALEVRCMETRHITLSFANEVIVEAQKVFLYTHTEGVRILTYIDTYIA